MDSFSQHLRSHLVPPGGEGGAEGAAAFLPPSREPASWPTHRPTSTPALPPPPLPPPSGEADFFFPAHDPFSLGESLDDLLRQLNPEELEPAFLEDVGLYR
jgi:hypothetical protein